MSYTGLVVVVPTRNRAELAELALASVLRADLPDVNVLVSDNSTDESQRERLRAHCEALGSDEVRWVCPPEPLPMTEHWAWALDQALATTTASHVSFLTDRMLFKPKALATLTALLATHPERVLTYDHDTVDDAGASVAVASIDWSGRLFELSSERLVLAAAHGTLFGQCYPRMLNTAMPRSACEEVRARFGSVFSSISPDFCLAFRCFDTFDTIAFYDRSLLIAHSLGRSNGASYGRGVDSPDAVDFQANVGRRGMNFAAPVPEMHTVANAIFHEYCFVRYESRSGRFPAIDYVGYLAANAAEVGGIVDPRLRQRMAVLLVEQGWTPARRRTQRIRFLVHRLPWLLHPLALARRLAFAHRDAAAVQRLVRLVRRLGVAVPGWLGVASRAEGIRYAERHDGLRLWWPGDVRWTLNGWRPARRLSIPRTLSCRS